MQGFYGKFQIYLKILRKMACYSHKRATVLSKGPFRVVCRSTFQILTYASFGE
jgi:hypothetical protein